MPRIALGRALAALAAYPRHTLLAALAAHPRHTLLGALVVGLLAGPRSPAALAAAVALVLLLGGDGRLVLATLATLLAGAVVADARTAARARSDLRLGEISTRATLLEHPRRRAFSATTAALQMDGERVIAKAPARVRWPAPVAPGAVLAVRGRLVALRARDAHERRRGAHAVLLASELRATGARRGGVAGVLDRVRVHSERALTAGVPAEQGALARGMVLGQDAALSDELRDDFRRSGLAHLVAASGANVILLATLVLAVAGALGLGLSARLVAAIALVAAYVPLAGGGPSIQRAGVMGCAGLVAALAGRPASRWYALLLAAACTLLWNPSAAADVGWQLSFAAVLALLALAPRLRVRLTNARMPRALAEALAVTAAATLGTAPLIALHFERLSLVSLPANLLAAPAVAPVMWLGVVAAAIGQVAPGLAALPAGLATLPLGYLGWLADAAAGVPMAEVTVASPGVAGVVALYACLGGAVLAARRIARRPRPHRLLCAALGAGAVAVAGFAGVAVVRGARMPPPPQDLTISFLDVGQGDATLIQHGRAAVLVDTGPPHGPLLRELRAAGVRRLDVLVVTHDALDHDGATGELLDALPVDLVLDGEEESLGDSGVRPESQGEGVERPPPVRALAAARGVRRVATDAGQVVRVGPIELRVLWPRREPPAAPGAEPNDRSTVLHVRDGAVDALLTADAESNVLGSLPLPRVEVLKVSHHGSADEGLPGVLDRVRPAAAIIAVGASNTYGHPAPQTLAALRAAVPVVRRTDHDGTVRVTLRDGRLQVERRR